MMHPLEDAPAVHQTTVQFVSMIERKDSLANISQACKMRTCNVWPQWWVSFIVVVLLMKNDVLKAASLEAKSFKNVQF